jgi:hypothetical protein
MYGIDEARWIVPRAIRIEQPVVTYTLLRKRLSPIFF